MDPVSAIGLASSILTFVDFATKLVSGTYEAYKTGTIGKTSDAQTVLQDLRRVSEELHHGTFDGAQSHHKELLKLADDCLKLSNELETLLDKLIRSAKDKNALWSSIRVSWLSIWKQKEVQGLERKLEKHRSQIILRLNQMIFVQQSPLRGQLDKIERQSAQLSISSATQLRDVQQTLQTLLDQSNQSAASRPTTDLCRPDLQAIVAALDQIRLQTSKIPRENNIIARLRFPSMYSREDSVETPEKGTLNWITEAAKDADDANSSSEYGGEFPGQEDYRRKVVSSLRSFLRDEHGVYFICGKAGSGKSTLVKFLADSGFATQNLETWSSGKKLILVHVYFWASGDALQMSQEGFLRTVLFQALGQCPELIPSIFSSEWECGESLLSVDTPFRIKELLEAFGKLKATSNFPQHRFCFFIDGLDEYQGDSVDHAELAKSIKAWAAADNVKVICTARPHSEFLDTFDDPDRTVFLHELNRDDIAMYAQSKLGDALASTPKWRNEVYGAGRPAEWFSSSVAAKADGVFLWARLIVRSLLSGISQYDSLDAMKDRLEHSPRDLDALFDKLLKQVEPVHQRRSDLMFSIASNDPYSARLNALVYFWIDQLENPDFPHLYGPSRLESEADIHDVYERVRHQLDAQTKGLLELVKHDTNTAFADHNEGPKKYVVGFFHRSVRDYIRSRERQSSSGLRVPEPEVYYRLQSAEAEALVRVASAPTIGNRSWQRYWWSIQEEAFRELRSKGIVLPAVQIASLGRTTGEFVGRLVEHSTQGKKWEGFDLGFPSIWVRIVAIDLRGQRYYNRVNLPSQESNSPFFYRAAHHQQRLYARRCVEQASSISDLTTDELKPLISAFDSDDTELTRLLLEKGAQLGDSVPILKLTERSFPEGWHKMSDCRDSPVEKGTTSTWMVLLRILGHWVERGLGSTSRTPQNIAECLENYLGAGADVDVVFLIRPWRMVDWTHQGFTTHEHDKTAYYMEFRDLLRVREKDSFENVIQMLDSHAEPGMWVRITSLFSGLAFQEAPVADRVAQIRKELQPLTAEQLREMYRVNNRNTGPGNWDWGYHVDGVVSKTDELVGEFAVRIC